jgi:hypothetical protein
VTPQPDAEHVEAELATMGETAGVWTAEPLTHNQKNGVSGGIWRIDAGGDRHVLKVLTRRKAAPPGWESSDDPQHWNYWRREALVYECDLPHSYGSAQLRSPRLRRCVERADGDLALWLEWVEGPAVDLMDSLERLAHRLGVAQGQTVAARTPPQNWMSRDFLRTYVEGRQVRRELVEDEKVWNLPLCRAFPNGAREASKYLVAQREHHLRKVESATRAICHLDVWSHNVVEEADGTSVLLDWSMTGDGALGEDIGNLIADTFGDMQEPAERLPEADERFTEAYLRGLADVGLTVDRDSVRSVIYSSAAAKYDWLMPLMLQRAVDGVHQVYGGGPDEEPEAMFRQRGALVVYLSRMAQGLR